MSALITDKLINPSGSIVSSAQGGYIDAAGSILGSPSFLPNYVIDCAGNLGTVPSIPIGTNCDFLATSIGSALEPGPWEVEKSSVETVGTNGSTNPANYAVPLSSFASANCIGYMSGVVSGIGGWTIQGSGTIGGVAYNGGGLIVTHGNNTLSGTTTVQTGANLQVGLNASNTVTKLTNLTVESEATATVFGAYTSGSIYVTQAVVNTGTINYTGPGVCGAGSLMLATSVVNNGVINIDDCMWRNQSTWSGTGTVNVRDGGTFQMAGSAINATTRININGCGWCNSAGVQVGAINAVSATFTHQARIHVETAACIKSNLNCNTDFAGLLTGNAALTIGTLGTPVNGIVHFSNVNNTYHGVITVDGTTLNASYGNSLQYAKIVLANGGRLGTNIGQTIGSLASSDITTYWASADFINNFIKNNGVTTYAGRLLWNGGTNTANYFLEGGAENELTLTRTGHTGNVYARGGARLILQGAGFTGVNGQVRAQTGGTVSAGTSTTASVTYLLIDATSNLEVRAAGAGAGLINVGTYGFAPSAGWKVNLPDTMAPGTYPIISYQGTPVSALPTLGINNTGRTVTFAYNNTLNPRILNMTLV